MGSVYEVLDLVTQRPRALKTMLQDMLRDRELRARFASEARVTAPIRSQHIVEVFDAGIDAASDLPFLVMELLEGADLGEILQKRGPLPENEALFLLAQLAFALDRTHDAGIVHRDLKPENLFVTNRDDGSPHLKILDFGIAKVMVESGNAKTTRSVGTPLYMSPEQIRGDRRIDRRADLYSVAHIAYAMLTGHAYFELEARESSTAYGLLLWVANGAPEPATVRARSGGIELHAGFDPWFAMATAVDPTARYGSVREMLDALALALNISLPRIRIASMEGQGAAAAGTLASQSPRSGPVALDESRSPRRRISRRRFPFLLGMVAIIVGWWWLVHVRQRSLIQVQMPVMPVTAAPRDEQTFTPDLADPIRSKTSSAQAVITSPVFAAPSTKLPATHAKATQTVGKRLAPTEPEDPTDIR